VAREFDQPLEVGIGGDGGGIAESEIDRLLQFIERLVLAAVEIGERAGEVVVPGGIVRQQFTPLRQVSSIVAVSPSRTATVNCRRNRSCSGNRAG
jgi:hypothetical protein